MARNCLWNNFNSNSIYNISIKTNEKSQLNFLYKRPWFTINVQLLLVFQPEITDRREIISYGSG
jgi:hypothetical protein